MNEKNAENLDDSSTGNILYQGGGNVVTYCHVTKNRVDVELSSGGALPSPSPPSTRRGIEGGGRASDGMTVGATGWR